MPIHAADYPFTGILIHHIQHNYYFYKYFTILAWFRDS